jgi:hypothetical protein
MSEDRRSSFRNVPRTIEHDVKNFRRVHTLGYLSSGQARKVTKENMTSGSRLSLMLKMLGFFAYPLRVLN